MDISKAFRIPMFVVVTKIDLATPQIFNKIMTELS